jgi:probable F420-dependent oxidoreductase
MTWAESARELESLGYATLFAPDHLNEGYGPITAMATAAAATTTLHVATAVFAADFRHPAILARELSSIDQLSHGRLEVGIGAGYQVRDYEGSGVPMDPPNIRVERLIEHVAVLRGLFSEEEFNFIGNHYRITDLQISPRPHREGGPPILIAGGGRRMLTFAGEYADIVGVNIALPSSANSAESAADALPASIDEKMTWVREAAGDRFGQLEIHGWLGIAEIVDNSFEAAEGLTSIFGSSAEEILASPLVLLGTVEEVIDRLHERRDRWGYSYFTLQQDVAIAFAPVVERLAGR